MRIINGESLNIGNYCDSNLKPILAKRVLDCIDFTIDKEDFFNNIEFELTDLGVTYANNAPVCVRDIVYSYDSIGLVNSSINARYSCESFSMTGQNPIGTTVGANVINIYNRYLGTTSIDCCINKCASDKQKFIEQNLEFRINNLNITISGTIGSQPFIGQFNYTGSIV